MLHKTINEEINKLEDAITSLARMHVEAYIISKDITSFYETLMEQEPTVMAMVERSVGNISDEPLRRRKCVEVYIWMRLENPLNGLMS